MASIAVNAIYMRHSGGTKFYEVVQFYNDQARRYVLVRRWGKMSAKVSGGETKIEWFASRHQCTIAAERIVSEKAGRGYHRESGDFGLHGIPLVVVEEVQKALGIHYANKDAQDLILTQLGLNVSGAPHGWVLEEETPVAQPEPVRDADWGSW